MRNLIISVFIFLSNLNTAHRHRTGWKTFSSAGLKPVTMYAAGCMPACRFSTHWLIGGLLWRSRVSLLLFLSGNGLSPCTVFYPPGNRCFLYWVFHGNGNTGRKALPGQESLLYRRRTGGLLIKR